jgi:hypothetical protein
MLGSSGIGSTTHSGLGWGVGKAATGSGAGSVASSEIAAGVSVAGVVGEATIASGVSVGSAVISGVAGPQAASKGIIPMTATITICLFIVKSFLVAHFLRS